MRSPPTLSATQGLASTEANALVRCSTDAFNRSVEQVHDDELAIAVTNLVHDGQGGSQHDVVASVARLYRRNRRAEVDKRRLRAVIDRLLADDELAGDHDALTRQAGAARLGRAELGR